MKIPFDIKYRPQIESGELKVETRDGKHVRIVSWDKNGSECKEIVALVTGATGTEICYIYTTDGLNPYYENMDLFIVTPEEELTDFENAFGRAMMEVPEPEEKEEWYQFLKEKAADLLPCCREQLKPGINFMLENNYKTAYKEGYDEGRTDALKDMPKWKRFAPIINDALSEQRICNELENSVLRVDVDGYCWIISREELNKLPKE